MAELTDYLKIVSFLDGYTLLSKIYDSHHLIKILCLSLVGMHVYHCLILDKDNIGCPENTFHSCKATPADYELRESEGVVVEQPLMHPYISTKTVINYI